MAIDKVRAYLDERGLADRILEAEASTATVALAAEAFGVEPGRIAKTLTFMPADKVILIDASKLAAVIGVPSLKQALSRSLICHTQPSASFCSGSAAASSGRM